MLLRICVPNRFQFRMMQDFRHFLFHPGSDIHYIGGAEILPEPLDSQAEAECIRKLRNEQDETARNTLVEHNLRLVVYIAKKFDNTGVGVEDLISIGTIGLMKAINTFNPDKNIKLATYASRFILGKILSCGVIPFGCRIVGLKNGLCRTHSVSLGSRFTSL